MTDNRVLSSLSNSTAAGKNAIINGAFDIWQRGTSFNPNTASYSADRWALLRSVSGSTVSRQTTSDTTNLPNIQYCIRVQRDSGNTATNSIYLSQSLENVNSMPFIGQTITLSFWARKGADLSGAPQILVGAGTGTDQNILGTWTNNTWVINQTPTLTTTWTRYVYTGTVASNKTQLGIDFIAQPTGTAGAADYFEITGVQLELGSSATPFSRAAGTIQQELAACQRYYYRMSSNWGGSYAHYGTAVGFSTTGAYGFIPVPVTMRIAPTSVDYGSTRLWRGSTDAPAVTSIALTSQGYWHNPYNIGLTLSTASGVTDNTFYFFGSNNNANGYLGFSAEL